MLMNRKNDTEAANRTTVRPITIKLSDVLVVLLLLDPRNTGGAGNSPVLKIIGCLLGFNLKRPESSPSASPCSEASPMSSNSSSPSDSGSSLSSSEYISGPSPEQSRENTERRSPLFFIMPKTSPPSLNVEAILDPTLAPRDGNLNEQSLGTIRRRHNSTHAAIVAFWLLPRTSRLLLREV